MIPALDDEELIEPMSPIASSRTDVLTLEEIARMAAEGGKPAETLMNVVALIAKRFKTDVCSVYLLEPDRANLVLAATVGLRPECVGTLRMGLHEGLAGLVAEQVLPVAVEQVKKHPRFKYFREAGEDAYQSFLGVPLIDHGVLQGVLVVQTIDAALFNEDEIRMLTEAAAAVAPVVSEARTLDRFIAPSQERLWTLARNLWWSWDHDASSLFRDLDPVRWRQLNHNPISLLLRDCRWRELEAPRAGAGAARPHQLRLSPPAGISARPTAPGARGTREFCGRVRWLIFPRSSACTNRFPIYSGGLGVLAGDHIKSASDLGIPLVGVGLFYGQGYFRQRLDLQRLAAGRISADRHQPSAHGAGHRHRTASRSRCRSKPAADRSARRSGA